MASVSYRYNFALLCIGLILCIFSEGQEKWAEFEFRQENKTIVVNILNQNAQFYYYDAKNENEKNDKIKGLIQDSKILPVKDKQTVQIQTGFRIFFILQGQITKVNWFATLKKGDMKYNVDSAKSEDWIFGIENTEINLGKGNYIDIDNIQTINFFVTFKPVVPPPPEKFKISLDVAKPDNFTSKLRLVKKGENKFDELLESQKQDLSLDAGDYEFQVVDCPEAMITQGSNLKVSNDTKTHIVKIEYKYKIHLTIENPDNLAGKLRLMRQGQQAASFELELRNQDLSLEAGEYEIKCDEKAEMEITEGGKLTVSTNDQSHAVKIGCKTYPITLKVENHATTKGLILVCQNEGMEKWRKVIENPETDVSLLLPKGAYVFVLDSQIPNVKQKILQKKIRIQGDKPLQVPVDKNYTIVVHEYKPIAKGIPPYWPEYIYWPGCMCPENKK